MALFLVTCLCVLPLFFPIFSRLMADEGSIPIAANDFDGDLIVNTSDIDDDNDGIVDILEIAENGNDIDSDGDGKPDRLDLDSDNDGILDWKESGALIRLDLSSIRKVGPRLVGEVGTNGLIDVFESPVDTGELAYSLSNVDSRQDDVPDFLDLDSDNDGWPDLREAGVWQGYDTDGDGRLDAPPGSVGNDGIPDYLQVMVDQSCCDLDGDGDTDQSPVNTDMADFPDYQDLDSDNDGIPDIIELNGTDADGDGRVDNFLDVTGGIDGPDGMDDGLVVFPYSPTDNDGNGVEDHVDFIAPPVETGPDSAGSESGQDPQSQEPVPVAPSPDEGGGEANDDVLSDDSGTGAVRTGLNSSGCSIYSARTDSMLFALVVLCIIVLGWRNGTRGRSMP